MPNNENNNNFFDLPKENNGTLNQPSIPVTPPQEPPVNQNIIEIPQSYYDKVEQEQKQKELDEAKRIEEQQVQREASKEMQGIFLFALINAFIIFGFIYTTVHYSMWTFLGIPILIIVLSIYFAIKDKKNSNYPSSVMVGGIICAIVSFIISMINEEQADLYMYYTIATAAIGFLGFFTSSIVTKIITNFKEIKALESIGYILYFVALIGVPYYCANKYHEEFYRIVFRNQVEVQAETEEDFVKRTMKARYGIEYTCKNKKHYINEQSRKEIVREECKDQNGIVFDITSVAYNEGSVQYVVKDTYLDVIAINPIKEKLTNKIKSATQASSVTVSLYPEENCFFFADCAECDEYYENYQRENDINRQYQVSQSINFEKYLKDSSKLLEDTNFKYVINVKGPFSPGTYQQVVDNVIKALNDSGYENKYGFVINVYRTISGGGDAYNTLAYKVKGEKESSKLFGPYQEVPTTNRRN